MLMFEIESLDGIDEALQPFYQEVDGKYRLAVEGIDPADELKSALQKEREERKSAKLRLQELEAKQAEAERVKVEAEKQSLLEKEQFKELYESERQKAEQTSKTLQEFEQRINEKTLRIETSSVASKHAAGDGQADLLAEQLQKFARVVDGEVTYEVGGVPVKVDVVIDQIKAKQPFLFRGNASTGGGATGAVRGSSGATRVSMGDMGGSPEQRRAAIAAKYDFSALQ